MIFREKPQTVNRQSGVFAVLGFILGGQKAYVSSIDCKK